MNEIESLYFVPQKNVEYTKQTNNKKAAITLDFNRTTTTRQNQKLTFLSPQKIQSESNTKSNCTDKSVITKHSDTPRKRERLQNSNSKKRLNCHHQKSMTPKMSVILINFLSIYIGSTRSVDAR